MRLQDALARKPATVTADDWKFLVVNEVTNRCLKCPDIPPSLHLAQIHEEFLDAWREEQGQSNPKAGRCARCYNYETLPRELLPLAWRFGWLIVAAICLKSLLLLVLGGIVLALEPRRIKP